MPDFALENGLEIADPSYFITEHRVAQLAQAKREASGCAVLDHGSAAAPVLTVSGGKKDDRGTVGAVARDRRGHLAAATSTGGMCNKWEGERLLNVPVPPY